MDRYSMRGPYDTWENQPTIGIAVKRARRRANLTQQQLADVAGIERVKLAQWERGHRRFPADAFAAIVRAAADTIG